jgi:hypothetical protein
MDLIDYGSSDDDSEASSGGALASRAAATTAASRKAAPVSILKTKNPTPAPAKENKKGRKILALQAVLPPHILEQLQQSQVQGGGNDESDDSEDEMAPSAVIASGSKTAKDANRATGSDAGIDSFLSALQGAAPVALGGITRSSFTSSLSKSSATTQTPASASSKLGAAFLSTTVVSSGSSGVRDIHGETSVVAAPSQAATSVVKAAPSVNEKPNNNRSLPRPPARIPRVLAAAPVISSLEDHSVSSESKGFPSATTTTTDATAAFPQGTMSSKRRRQERERLLRQGQLDAALGDDSRAMSMNQPDSLGPTDGSGEHVDTTGMVRMSATSMYDPSQGQAVTGSTKGRGKNQINHLLASAASLELDRARGMAGGNAGKTHRTNAKRKYGW